MSDLRTIINEEVDRVVKEFNLSGPEVISNVLNELFNMTTDKLMTSMGSVEFDDKSSIANENWESFVDVLTQSISANSETWLKYLKEVKVKILCYKYFTKQELISREHIEQHLKTDIKPFFTALQNYRDLEDFRAKVFLLPSALLYSLVRYLFFLSEELKDSIKVTGKELTDVIVGLRTGRMKAAEDISKLSKGYQNLFDFNRIKDLYDCGLFFEDNFINRGVNEFLVKLLNHEFASANLRDIFPGAMLKDILTVAETSASYMAHVTAIRDESSSEYFTMNGEQIGNKFSNDILTVKENDYDGYVVDKKSRLKEPNEKINNTSFAPATGGDGGDGELDGGDGGSGGGGGFGGGGFGGDFGNADFGGDFADPGEEGEVPGADEPTDEPAADGTPMPDADADGLPDEFGTEEDNTDTSDDDKSEVK